MFDKIPEFIIEHLWPFLNLAHGIIVSPIKELLFFDSSKLVTSLHKTKPMANIYMKIIVVSFVFMIPNKLFSQTGMTGRVIDEKSLQPLEAVTVGLAGQSERVVTDKLGIFLFKNVDKGLASEISFSCIGYQFTTIAVSAFKNGSTIKLVSRQVDLKSISVSSLAGNQFSFIGKTDIAMRGVSNSQEILRIIPGIVIGQHQGGGKAEQIFLRGFDADHGTDFRMDVDGIPVNMVSHAHGQGFADSHFIIPETIQEVDFKKGPYSASQADFATTGSVEFTTKTFLKENVLKAEAGGFNTYRLVAVLNLLNKQKANNEQCWYAAAEYRYADGYFNNPQYFNRMNLFTKYNRRIFKTSTLTASLSTFWSKWNASGQIPLRAVKSGAIGYYGAIDPLEGGVTSRTNINIILLSKAGNGLIKNQLFYSHLDFDLHTDFTFYLVDTINADEIRQKEARNLLGYNGSFTHTSYIKKLKVSSLWGLQVRADLTGNSALSHTKDRFILLNRIKLGDISQLTLAPYVSETFRISEHFSIGTGLRYDRFFYKYKNKFEGDTTLPGTGTYKAGSAIVCPKLTFNWYKNNKLQFYLNTGKGYHSNDARAAVVNRAVLNLPAAYSADLGSIFKPIDRLLVNAAVWAIYLQEEYVYSGDGGAVDFSGRTRRLGFDFSARYEPVKSLYFDIDVNYARGRALDLPAGNNYIPLAPAWTSSAGLTYTAKQGISGSIRYRFVGNRPGNEDNSFTAEGYFITDAVLKYRMKAWEFGVTVNNLFNTRWKETQFVTETRLRNEARPVDDICFTAGTPFALLCSLSYVF